METYGLGPGGRMAGVHFLYAMRSTMYLYNRDTPGLPESHYRPFVLCGVIASVHKVLAADAVDPADPCFGDDDLSLDSSDSEVFVGEDLVLDESVVQTVRALPQTPPEPDAQQSLGHFVGNNGRYRYPEGLRLFRQRRNWIPLMFPEEEIVFEDSGHNLIDKSSLSNSP
ncbi:unnamed protein product [Discula destructiva]